MKRPEIKIPSKIEIPQAEMRTLRNGVRLYALHNSNQGVLRASFVFRAGTSYQSVPFSASATVNTLSEGTTEFSSREIAERLDFVGSYFDANIDRDYSVVTFCSLGKFAAETMEIARQIILHPTFPEEEISSYRAKRKEQLSINRSKPDFLSRELFGKALFGENHPYGVASDASAYDSLRREDIEAFYLAHYTAENCFAIVCGDISDADTAAVAAIAEELPSSAAAMRKIGAPETEHLRRMVIDGALQSSIKIGLPLFSRRHPDFIDMQILSTALGGYFGSRLMQNLRNRHGYTYGAYAAMINLDEAGYFVASAEVAAAATGKAIEEIFSEIDALRRKPLPEKELEIVRRMIIGDVMRVMDGPFGVADVTIENIQNDTDNSYTDDFLRRVESITPKELQIAAERYLDSAAMCVTVVGADYTPH